MGFGDLKTSKGITELDGFIFTRSYIEGYQPSQADKVVFEALGKKPAVNFQHALRWYNHILSFGDEMKSFPGQAKPISAYGTAGAAAAEEDEDELDLFGSDDEVDEEAEKIREERLKAYAEKKSKKPGPVAKSLIVLDVKPWDDETDMAEVEQLVRTIEMDGLLWGQAKLVPVGYGIKKLQIGCVVEDEKVGTDVLEE